MPTVFDGLDFFNVHHRRLETTLVLKRRGSFRPTISTSTSDSSENSRSEKCMLNFLREIECDESFDETLESFGSDVATHLIDFHATAKFEVELLENRGGENPVHFIGVVFGVVAKRCGGHAKDLLSFLGTGSRSNAGRSQDSDP